MRPKTRRSKPVANPWRSLPRLAAIFDQATPQSFFKGSKVDALEELSMTETQLLEQTAGLLGLTLPQLVRAGALVYAKREFINHKKYLSPASSSPQGTKADTAPATPEDNLPRSGSGVAGVADLRIQAAYDALLASKNPVTPAKLATRALTGYPTALRWLKIHHPELLAPKPPATETAAPKPDTAPAKEVPQTTTAKPAGETRAAKTKRAAAKAKPLPKKLRNPKNHPDLIADDAHVKTAHKQPETAQRDHSSPKAQKPAKRFRNPENEPF
jgi:hypothetical protein